MLADHTIDAIVGKTIDLTGHNCITYYVDHGCMGGIIMITKQHHCVLYTIGTQFFWQFDLKQP